MQQRSRLSCFLMLATFSAVLMQQRSRFSQKTTETVVFDQTNDYSVDKLVRALNGLCDGALVVFFMSTTTPLFKFDKKRRRKMLKGKCFVFCDNK